MRDERRDAETRGHGDAAKRKRGLIANSFSPRVSASPRLRVVFGHRFTESTNISRACAREKNGTTAAQTCRLLTERVNVLRLFAACDDDAICARKSVERLAQTTAREKVSAAPGIRRVQRD